MNALFAFAAQELWHIAGWTMLHYLWLGALVGLFAILCRLLLRRASANLRYATALTCLAVLAALPAAIATWLTSYSLPLQGGARGGISDPVATIELNSPEFNSPPATNQHEIIDLRNQPQPLAAVANQPVVEIASAITPNSESSPNPSVIERGMSFAAIEACVPYLPWLWIIGTPLTFALLAAGIVGTKRLQRASHAIDDPRIADMLARLQESLRIGRRVSIAICDRIASPVLIGIVRPIILLPPAALTGWSPDEIEMVLLHELAHVRRWDNLVNLIQRLIESLLFFHPAVWLVSTWARRERESCCDAFVVRRTERPHAYAELLVALAAQIPRSVLFHPAASSAMSAGPLRTRIRRILQLEDDPMLISGRSLALMLATLVTVATLAVLYVPTIGQAEESTTEVTEDTEGKAGVDKRKSKNSSSTGSSTNSEAEPKPENAKEPQVVATLPPNADALNPVTYAPPNDFIAAYKAAREKNLYVELLRRKDDLVLIVVPQPNEANWPDVLGESPRKDRVIAEKAYARLGLKLAPVTRAEAKYREFTSQPPPGVMIVGGNVPKGLPLPSILTAVGEQNITDIGALLAWLESESGRSDKAVKCYAIADDQEYLFDAAPPAEAVGSKPQPAPATPQPAIKSSSSLTADRILQAYEIPSDLVDEVEQFPGVSGVWDERNRYVVQATQDKQQQFKKLLEETPKWRDPKAARDRENTPVRVRNVAGKTVLEWRSQGLSFIKDHEQDGVTVVETAPGSPAAWNNIRPGDFLRYIEGFATNTLAELESVIKTLFEGFASESKTLTMEFGRPHPDGRKESLVKRLLLRPDHPNAPGNMQQATQADQLRAMMRAQQNPKQSRAVSQQDVPSHDPPSPENEDAASLKRRTAARPTRSTQESDKSHLRYDGKSFTQWRDQWQNELSAAKRAEAVRALAAFGKAGYGKEATGVILDVAGNYDFFQEAYGTPQKAVLDELTPESRSHDLAKFWLPDLVERLKKEPKKWQPLAGNLLYRLRTDDPDVIAILQSLAQNGSTEIRTAALAALVRLAKSQDGVLTLDDKTRQLLADALNSKDPPITSFALRLLLQYPGAYYSGGGFVGGKATPPNLMYQPELLPLLFHDDEPIRQQARDVLQHINEQDAPQVVEQLVAVLKDDSRKKDHLHAIRALAAMGKQSEKATPVLVGILKQSDDKETLTATLVALTRTAGEPTRMQTTGSETTFNVDSLLKACDKLLSPAELEAATNQIGEDDEEAVKRLDQEDNAILPPTNQQQLGGGGGFF